MMSRFKYLIIASLVILPSFAISQTNIIKSDERIELSEVQKLRAENFRLRVQVTQLETRIKDIEYVAEGQKLVEEFRKVLHADEKDTFDWSTFKFSKPPQK
jgi:hypothetical protein